MEYWDQLQTLHAKIERTEHHILDLRDQWSAFYRDAYKVTSNDDAQTGERVWTVGYIPAVPDPICAVIGDAIHNLRCALDHILHHLIVVATNGAGPFDHAYFPIGDNATDFIDKKLSRAEECKTAAKGIVKRLRPDAVKAIKAIEPYDGGRGAFLFHLHKLDIIDKHRLLLAVAGRNPSHTMTPSEIETMKDRLSIDFPVQGGDAVIFQTDSTSPFPLKSGDELARVPISEANDDMHFPFVIAFGEPGVLYGEPVVATLYKMSMRVRAILRDFDRNGILR